MDHAVIHLHYCSKCTRLILDGIVITAMNYGTRLILDGTVNYGTRQTSDVTMIAAMNYGIILKLNGTVNTVMNSSKYTIASVWMESHRIT